MRTSLLLILILTLSVACGSPRRSRGGSRSGGGGAVTGDDGQQPGNPSGWDGPGEASEGEGEGEGEGAGTPRPGEGEGEPEGPGPEVECIDEDGDGYPAGPEPDCPMTDCDDSERLINPGAPEVCDNGYDEDCDGDFDANDADCSDETECVDADNDRYGRGPGCLGRDCDEGDARVNEGAREECGDLIDNNCNGLVDEDCEGGGAGGGLTCWEIDSCLAGCEADRACQQRCQDDADPNSLGLYIDLNDCAAENCPEGAPQREGCIFSFCAGAIRTCIFDGDNMLNCVTGYTCLSTCGEDNGCADQCQDKMTAGAKALLEAMANCLTISGCFNPGQDTNACAERNCSREVEACFDS